MKTKTEITPEIAPRGEVQDIPLDFCLPNPQNEKRPVDEEFLNSLRNKGQQVIAMVRPHPEREGFYDIIDGERRQEGMWAIGLRTWRAEVREMSDQEADELRALLNAQRRGLDWQQTCKLIAGYLERHRDDEDAAARIGSALGVTTAQVRRRARMLENLSPAWRQTIDSGALPAWTADHFEILTVFDEKFQEGLHKDIHYNANGMTVSELKEEISSQSKTLKAVPWDLDDVTLVPKAGACTGCNTRSDALVDLFGASTDTKNKDAACLNGDCFAKKLQASTKRKADQLLEKHPEAIKVAVDYTVRGKDMLRSHESTPAKKGEKGAVPALLYGDNGKVSLGYVKVKKSAEPKDKSPKALAKEAEQKRMARIDALALEKLSAIINDKGTEFHEDAYPVLLQYCLVHAVGMEIDGEAAAARIRAYSKKPVKAEEVWPGVADCLVRSLRSVGWNLENKKGDISEDPDVKLAAWMVEADFAALRKEAEEEIAQGPAEAEAAVPAAAANDDDSWDLPDDETEG